MKYKLTQNTKNNFGTTLYQIEATGMNAEMTYGAQTATDTYNYELIYKGREDTYMTPEELKQNAMIDEAVASAELAMPENEWRDTLVEEVGDCINTDSPKNFTRVQNFIQNLLDQHSAHLVERIKKKKERAMFHPMRNQTGEAVYEYNMGYNDALDQAIDIVKDKTNGM